MSPLFLGRALLGVTDPHVAQRVQLPWTSEELIVEEAEVIPDVVVDTGVAVSGSSTASDSATSAAVTAVVHLARSDGMFAQMANCEDTLRVRLQNRAHSAAVVSTTCFKLSLSGIC